MKAKKAEGPYYTKRYESPLYGRILYLVKVTFQKRSSRLLLICDSC